MQCQGVSSNNDCCPVEVWLRQTKLYRTAMNFKRHIPDSNELQKTHIPDCDEIQKKPLAPKRHERVSHEGWGREEVLGVWISEAFPKNLVAVCHNSQSATLLSDSGLVMYFSTLPAPSSSAPCILAILTHLQGAVS